MTMLTHRLVIVDTVFLFKKLVLDFLCYAVIIMLRTC